MMRWMHSKPVYRELMTSSSRTRKPLEAPTAPGVAHNLERVADRVAPHLRADDFHRDRRNAKIKSTDDEFGILQKK